MHIVLLSGVAGLMVPWFCAAGAQEGAGGMSLASNGKAQSVIAVAKGASAVEQCAARELADYLGQVTGASFQITSPENAGERAVIAVGPGAAKAISPDLKLDIAALGQDGIVVQTRRPHLILTGADGAARGTLYAVYTFLEDTVGVRWWTSADSFVPRKGDLQIPDLNVTYVPKLFYREPYYRDLIRSPIFPARLKVNGHYEEVPAEYGGHCIIAGWCHTFYELLPPDKYFDKHPDWYSEVEGKRTTKGAQLCLTNEEMRKELTRVALEWLKNTPNAMMISISQNDCGGRCECSNCKRVEEEEGAPSGVLVRFVNAVAEDIEKEYPHVLVETLAYQYTRKPPLHVKPRKNVVIRLCSIECDFAHPLDSDANARFRDDIKAWSAIAPNLYIWDYVTNFSNFLAPHPNLRMLAPNIRFFLKNNAIGIFEQGDEGNSVGDFVRLRVWLISHLLWDPSRDVDRLMDEFLQGYYGAAAPHLKAYFDLVHKAVEPATVRLSCFSKEPDFLDLSTMNEATKLLDAAQKAVAADPVLSLRIRRDRMPLDSAWLVRYSKLREEAERTKQPFLGPQDPAAAYDHLMKAVKEFDAGPIREGGPMSDYDRMRPKN